MGGADIIPGVSGGTVALILGIYGRLVTAISHFDVHLVAHLRAGRWKQATTHIDLRFLIALGCGILAGIVGLAELMNRLLIGEATRPFTLAAFFGLIFASSILVARMIGVSNMKEAVAPLALGVAGAVFAFWLTGLRPLSADPTFWYVFLSGAIAICAMILPGISGAFILLLLGMYVYITGIVKRIRHFDLTLEETTMLVVFAAGCAIGLLTFSKLLRWLLTRHHAATMALLCGFMLGSLRKIWPLKTDITTPDDLEAAGVPAEEFAHLTTDEHLFRYRVFENRLPEEFTTHVLLIVLTAVVAAALVLALDWISRRFGKSG